MNQQQFDLDFSTPVATETRQNTAPPPPRLSYWEHYQRVKTQLPSGAILFYRVGDFYEVMGEDAIKAVVHMNVKLNERDGVKTCGVPFHALDAYLAKLIRVNCTVAVCDGLPPLQ